MSLDNIMSHFHLFMEFPLEQEPSHLCLCYGLHVCSSLPLADMRWKLKDHPYFLVFHEFSSGPNQTLNKWCTGALPALWLFRTAVSLKTLISSSSSNYPIAFFYAYITSSNTAEINKGTHKK